MNTLEVARQSSLVAHLSVSGHFHSPLTKLPTPNHHPNIRTGRVLPVSVPFQHMASTEKQQHYIPLISIYSLFKPSSFDYGSLVYRPTDFAGETE